MKKRDNHSDMRSEYDFTGAERGKYAQRYAEGTNVILLDPDLREVFPDSESVNRVLHAIVDSLRQKSA
ncbi:MAG: hypothetical protein JW849_10650 [Phycisphaerae bacterium]|nr:hypothetical protein [Phycisphaerae bacterium]